MNIKQHINLKKKPWLSCKPVNPAPDNQELSVQVFHVNGMIIMAIKVTLPFLSLVTPTYINLLFHNE
jgi:hypothetical protein